MDLSCGKCSTGCKDSNSVQCGGFCKKYFHLKCFNLSKYEYDTMFKYKNIKFFCDDCLNYIEITNENYKNLISIVKQNDEKITKEIVKTNKVVEEKIEQVRKEIVKEIKSNKISENDSYASKLKTATKNMPVILKPKNNQSSASTEKEVKEKVKPSSLNIQIKGIDKRNDGAVAIKCLRDNDRNVLVDEIKEKMGNEYEIQVPKMRKPKILITGMSEELEKDRIIEAIRKQNDIEDNNLICVKVYKSYKNPRVYNAIIETDGNGFEAIMKRGKINIEWDRCMVYESCNVLRCFKCWGFNHKATKCNNDNQLCAKCSEAGHSYKECKNNFVKCINCDKAKQRLNLQDIDTNHDCRSGECPVLQRKNRVEAERIAY